LPLAPCQALSNSFTAALSRLKWCTVDRWPRGSAFGLPSFPTARVPSERSARFQRSASCWSVPRDAPARVSSVTHPSWAETFSPAATSARPVWSVRLCAWGCAWELDAGAAAALTAAFSCSAVTIPPDAVL
jgi:hypothetical protein